MPIIGEWLSVEILHGVPTDDLIHYSVLKVNGSRLTYHCPMVRQFIIINFWLNAFTICQSYFKILHRVPNEDLIHYSILKVHQTKLTNNFPVVRHFIILIILCLLNAFTIYQSVDDLVSTFCMRYPMRIAFIIQF